jgi:hypothetical protein
MKILVLASMPISAELLRAAVGEEIDDAEVLVIAPALNPSTLRFWMSDADQAISRAEVVQEETVVDLEEDGIEAAGDTGESEPLVAIEDALATFAADRMVIFTHAQQDQDHRETDLAAAVEQRFAIPVVRREVPG